MRHDAKDPKQLARKTMPAELRAFAKPEPEQRLVAPENEADFKASIEALRLLNGGPTADPFYVDPARDPASPADSRPPPSTAVYAAPAPLPAAVAAPVDLGDAKVILAAAVAPKPERTSPALGDSEGARDPEESWGPETSPLAVEREGLDRGASASAVTRSAMPAAEAGASRRTVVAALAAMATLAAVFVVRATLAPRTPADFDRTVESVPAMTSTMHPPTSDPSVDAVPVEPGQTATASSPKSSASAIVPSASSSAPAAKQHVEPRHTPTGEARAVVSAGPGSVPTLTPIAPPSAPPTSAPTALGGPRVFGN